MARKSTLPANGLKMLLLWHRLTLSLMSTLLMMTSVFMTAAECLFVCINSMRIASLIHGFVLVKTWLLIAYDSAFYAIITYVLVYFHGKHFSVSSYRILMTPRMLRKSTCNLHTYLEQYSAKTD